MATRPQVKSLAECKYRYRLKFWFAKLRTWISNDYWDGKEKTWLVTAFRDDNGKFAGGGKTSNTPATQVSEVPEMSSYYDSRIYLFVVATNDGQELIVKQWHVNY